MGTITTNTTDGKVFWRSTVCVNGQCNSTESTVGPDELGSMPSLWGEQSRFGNMFGSDFARMDDIFGRSMPLLDGVFDRPLNGVFGSDLPRSYGVADIDSGKESDEAAPLLLNGTLSDDGAEMGMGNAASTSSTFEQTLGADGQIHYTMTTCSNGECKTTSGEGQPEVQAKDPFWSGEGQPEVQTMDPFWSGEGRPEVQTMEP